MNKLNKDLGLYFSLFADLRLVLSTASLSVLNSLPSSKRLPLLIASECACPCPRCFSVDSDHGFAERFVVCTASALSASSVSPHAGCFIQKTLRLLPRSDSRLLSLGFNEQSFLRRTSYVGAADAKRKKH